MKLHLIRSVFGATCATLSAWALILFALPTVSPVVNGSGEEADLIALLRAPEGCPAPCWAGIRVGVTTDEEAVAILQLHPWIQTVYASAAQISWRWNGQQPALIDGERDGIIGLGGGVVRRLRIQTRVRYGDVWRLLGSPGDALLVRPLTRYSAFQISMYDSARVVINTFGCPVTPSEFWGATTTIGIGDVWTTEALNGIRFDIYEQSGWWRPLRMCRPGVGR